MITSDKWIYEDLTEDEIKYKYLRYFNMGVTYANPPSYDSSRNHQNKSFIIIDYELEDEYNNL